LLDKANLEEALLDKANLKRARLRGANLSNASLSGALLTQATLDKANLSNASLSGADLSMANLNGTHIFGANLSEANLSGATLSGAQLSLANLSGANLNGATLNGAQLSMARLSEAQLSMATLNGATLNGATLNGSDLSGANLSGVNLSGATLNGARFSRALLNAETSLDGVMFSQPPTLLGVRWNGAPLDAIDWGQVSKLGDEAAINVAKTRTERVRAYRNAVRAYHGLVVALEAQGLTVPARRFRRRERLLDRRTLRQRPSTWFAYAFYTLLNLLSGQGEAPDRIFAAYAIIVGTFTGIYWVVSQQFATSSQPLKWYEALVLSLSSFHGRGFFPSQIGLGDPLAVIAAVEAVFGLFIELILIATFTNRFLNK
jgi:uncharacterized protein YjbI with pentapeptide repeats